ncbi:MAG: permease-like cell division protein FtsX, partial [Candidatus Saccharimonadales bacterium]
MADKKASRTKLRDNKRVGRAYLTWIRMFRYGVNNFTRNAWLTTAATAVMTITLLIVFSTVVARTMLSDTVTDLRQNIKLAIFLKSDIDPADVVYLRDKLKNDSNVKTVDFVSTEEGRKIYLAQNVNVNDKEQLETLADISIPAKFDITVLDPDKVDSIESLMKNDRTFRDNLFDESRKLDGDNRSAIKTISGWASTADRVGLFATIVFVAISTLIVFNTIRMAIFNRRDEIEMMKLIGADKNFIRGPFVVEAVMYGFFAAVIATALGYFALLTFRGQIAGWGIAVDRLANDMVLFSPFVALAMLVLGALIGVISARLAVRR